MKVIYDFPPNIEELRKHFAINDRVIFTYGDAIYNPGHGHIPDDLMVHEQTHTVQQGTDPAAWWDKYIADKQFRLSQELEAYHNQYEHFKLNRCTKPSGKIRKQRLSEFLTRIAGDLSSPVYGNIISYQEARERIANG